jgi:hypothetical protein
MKRAATVGALLVALGLGAGARLGAWRAAAPVEPPAVRGAPRAAAESATVAAAGTRADRGGEPSTLQRQLDRLRAQLAAEAASRRRLEARLERLATELAAQERGAVAEPENPTAAQAAAAGAPTPRTDGVHGSPDDPGPEALTAMERALAVAGIDAATVADIRRRRDELALSEIYLRDLAAREGWLDTPRFREEMMEIERQRTSIREEIGDDAYDRYLAALDHPNRVAVDEVLLESPAALAGLQAGDVILRYGERRIFAPKELVDATRAGMAGEPVRIEILRQGQRLEVELPRGPLGVKIAATRAPATDG